MKRLERRRLSRMIIALLATAALAQGCALFGGSDEEDLAGGNGEFGTENGDGMGAGSNMSGSEMAGGETVAGLETVYFDYDRALVRDDQKPTLRANASSIQSNAGWRTIVIEGHCDERGSEEYNLALGERRANAAKQYLVDSGVSAARLDTVSFGESKPSVQGHDDSAWKWNRRAEFRVIR